LKPFLLEAAPFAGGTTWPERPVFCSKRKLSIGANENFQWASHLSG
jgi:hypothetical protein